MADSCIRRTGGATSRPLRWSAPSRRCRRKDGSRFSCF